MSSGGYGSSVTVGAVDASAKGLVATDRAAPLGVMHELAQKANRIQLVIPTLLRMGILLRKPFVSGMAFPAEMGSSDYTIGVQ
jgi:hypothetical protein